MQQRAKSASSENATVQPAAQRWSAMHELLITFDRPGTVRLLLAVAAVAGLFACVLGAGNRFTRGPLFLYIPEVSLLPPIGRVAWDKAFAIHQQSPLWALCGGYQVGGMESIAVYQWLYLWEWVRIGSVAVLSAALLLLGGLGVGRILRGVGRTETVAAAWLAAGVAVYVVLRYFADHAGLFATLNVGQYRHALDSMVWSGGLGLLVAAASTPTLAGLVGKRLAWAFAIALDIGFGALLEAINGGTQWTEFPSYSGGLLPGMDRLFAFNPGWRNFTENGYLIQACHRLLSFGLWLAAFAAMVMAWKRKGSRLRPALLLGLLTLEGALGVLTLTQGLPVVLSGVHQVLAIFVMAAALLPGADARADGWIRPPAVA